MALPTVIKTWQHDVNILYGGTTPQGGQVRSEADNGDLLVKMKDALLGFASNPWTVVASSDSITAGLFGAVGDLWADSGDIHWDGLGGPRSWILLKQSQIATNFQLLIDCNHYNSLSNRITMTFCVDGFDTGSISTTSPPTPNGSRTWAMDFDTSSGWTYNGGLVSANIVTGRVHVMMDSTGKLTRVIVCRDGQVHFVLIIDIPDDAVAWTPDWTDPVIVIHRAKDDQTRGNYSDLNDAVCGVGYYTGSYNNTFGVYMTSEFYNGAAVGQHQTFPDDVTQEWPMCPIGLYCSVSYSGMGGPRRATLTDLWWGSTVRRTGDTYPVSATPTKEFAHFGDLIFPWNGTTPLVW